MFMQDMTYVSVFMQDTHPKKVSALYILVSDCTHDINLKLARVYLN